jgi:hypothetical protein
MAYILHNICWTVPGLVLKACLNGSSNKGRQYLLVIGILDTIAGVLADECSYFNNFVVAAVAGDQGGMRHMVALLHWMVYHFLFDFLVVNSKLSSNTTCLHMILSCFMVSK